MKKLHLLALCSLLVACDDGQYSPDEPDAAGGKADDAALRCAENTPSPLDGRNIEDMQRTGKPPRSMANEADVAALEADGTAKLLLDQVHATAVHFGREDVLDLVDTADSGVTVGRMTYSDLDFDIVLFFEDARSHGLAFHADSVSAAGEIGINYDIVGCASE
jgi:hypothetical protein